MSPRGIGSFFMMPITGLMTGKFDPRKLLTCGLIVGGHAHLAVTREPAGWLLGLSGRSSCRARARCCSPLLTTVAMDAIPRERMGNATSLFNLMRNLGGSIGIAMTGTPSRGTSRPASPLGANVTALDAETQTPFAQMRAGFMAAGADAVTPRRAPTGALRHGAGRRPSSFVGLFEAMDWSSSFCCRSWH
jgi:DHA2 family multidrug resistance protein